MNYHSCSDTKRGEQSVFRAPHSPHRAREFSRSSSLSRTVYLTLPYSALLLPRGICNDHSCTRGMSTRNLCSIHIRYKEILHEALPGENSIPDKPGDSPGGYG